MLALLAGVSSRLTRVGTGRGARGEATALPPPPVRRSLLALAVFLSAVFLLQAGFFAAQSFFALRIVDLGGGLVLVGVGRALQAAVEVPVMAWTSRRSNPLRPVQQFALGCLLGSPSSAAGPSSTSAASATMVNVVGGLAFALTSVSAVVIVDELVPLRYRATGQTLARADRRRARARRRPHRRAV